MNKCNKMGKGRTFFYQAKNIPSAENLITDNCNVTQTSFYTRCTRMILLRMYKIYDKDLHLDIVDDYGTVNAKKKCDW